MHVSEGLCEPLHDDCVVVGTSHAARH
jgi:hypothetical protein